VFKRTDVVKWAELDEMFDAAEREFGEIDIVCAGAGVYEPVGSPWPIAIESYLTGSLIIFHFISCTGIELEQFLATSWDARER
jgi:NAD(P)-dependent dehydrogenase (short-subunit alcohol dehydrogenase family)